MALAMTLARRITIDVVSSTTTTSSNPIGGIFRRHTRMRFSPQRLGMCLSHRDTLLPHDSTGIALLQLPLFVLQSKYSGTK